MSPLQFLMTKSVKFYCLEECGQLLQPQLQPTQLPVLFFFFHILLIINTTTIRRIPPTTAVDRMLAAAIILLLSKPLPLHWKYSYLRSRSPYKAGTKDTGSR